jgi:hypothetical protein
MSAPADPEVRIGALFKPNQPIRLLPETARQVERLGFDELWVAEDCLLNGGLTAAAAALAVTRRLSSNPPPILIGTTCANQLECLNASGASSIVIVPVGEGPDEQLEALATEVLPLCPRQGG